MIQQKKLQNKKKVLFVIEEIYVFCFFFKRFRPLSVSGQIINKFHDQLHFLYEHRHDALSRSLRLYQVGKLLMKTNEWMNFTNEN